jgi:hypothetical protein
VADNKPAVTQTTTVQMSYQMRKCEGCNAGWIAFIKAKLNLTKRHDPRDEENR